MASERSVKVTLIADTSQYVTAMNAARKATAGNWFYSRTRAALVGLLWGCLAFVTLSLAYAVGMIISSAV